MSHQGLDNAALVCEWQIRPDSLKYLEVCVSVWRSKPCVSVSSRLARRRRAACIRCDLQCMLCVKRKSTAPDREPSGTWLVCVCVSSRLHVLICCLCVCVYMKRVGRPKSLSLQETERDTDVVSLWHLSDSTVLNSYCAAGGCMRSYAARSHITSNLGT